MLSVDHRHKLFQDVVLGDPETHAVAARGGRKPTAPDQNQANRSNDLPLEALRVPLQMLSNPIAKLPDVFRGPKGLVFATTDDHNRRQWGVCRQQLPNRSRWR